MGIWKLVPGTLYIAFGNHMVIWLNYFASYQFLVKNYINSPYQCSVSYG